MTYSDKATVDRRHSLTERALAENTTPIALVIEAIKQGGGQSGAAKILGISHTAVRYHLRRAGLAVRTTQVALIEGAK